MRKGKILKEMIDNMSSTVKKRFDKKYPNILNEIYPYITKINNYNISRQDREDIEEWWDE